MLISLIDWLKGIPVVHVDEVKYRKRKQKATTFFAKSDKSFQWNIAKTNEEMRTKISSKDFAN